MKLKFFKKENKHLNGKIIEKNIVLFSCHYFSLSFRILYKGFFEDYYYNNSRNYISFILKGGYVEENEKQKTGKSALSLWYKNHKEFIKITSVNSKVLLLNISGPQIKEQEFLTQKGMESNFEYEKFVKSIHKNDLGLKILYPPLNATKSSILTIEELKEILNRLSAEELQTKLYTTFPDKNQNFKMYPITNIILNKQNNKTFWIVVF